MEQVQNEFEEYNGSTKLGNVSVNGAEESKEKVDSTNESLDEFAESKVTATLNADTSTANSNIETSQALKGGYVCTRCRRKYYYEWLLVGGKGIIVLTKKGQLEKTKMVQAVTDITS